MLSSTTYQFRHFALLFARLETEWFTGKVLAEATPRSAFLYFAQGRLLHAVTDNLVGEDALYNLLSWDKATLSLQAEAQPSSISPSLDEHQLALLRETLKVMQAKGRFETAEPVSQPALVTPPGEPVAMEAKEAVQIVAPSPSPQPALDPLVQMIAQPVEWGTQLQIQPVAGPPISARPGELKLEGSASQSVHELEQPLNFNFSLPTAAPAKTRRPTPTLPSLRPPEVVNNESQFSRCLPPGKPAEAGLRLDGFKLTELVCRVAGRWPNAYILVSLSESETGLILIEQGQPSAVRYATGNTTLKAQAAYDALEKVVATSSSQVSVYETELNLLQGYRTLFGGQYLLTNVQTATLDVTGLVGEHARRRATVALRVFNDSQMIFYFIYQGQALGSFQLQNNRLERGGEVRTLMREPGVRMDLLEAGPAEVIELGLPQMLLPGQASVLTEAANCVLGVLATLAGPEKILSVTRRILENSASLFPCLQRLGVAQREDRLSLSWTFDQTQAFVNRVEAQTAFNFLLTALFNQHANLIDPATLRELARRAIYNQHLELEKENLTLDCLK